MYCTTFKLSFLTNWSTLINSQLVCFDFRLISTECIRETLQWISKSLTLAVGEFVRRVFLRNNFFGKKRRSWQYTVYCRVLLKIHVLADALNRYHYEFVVGVRKSCRFLKPIFVDPFVWPRVTVTMIARR